MSVFFTKDAKKLAISSWVHIFILDFIFNRRIVSPKNRIKMKKISSLILGSVLALNTFGGNISVNGSTDPENPIMLSSYTFSAADDLLWKGINKDS